MHCLWLSIIAFVFSFALAISQFFALSRQACKLQLQNSYWSVVLYTLDTKNQLRSLKELVEDRPSWSNIIL